MLDVAGMGEWGCVSELCEFKMMLPGGRPTPRAGLAVSLPGGSGPQPPTERHFPAASTGSAFQRGSFSTAVCVCEEQ